MLATVFQQIDGASKVVIKEFLGTGLPVNSSQHTRIGSTIEYPVNTRKIDKVMFIADIPNPDINAQGAKWLEIRLTSFSNQTIDTGDTNTRHVFKKPTGNH